METEEATGERVSTGVDGIELGPDSESFSRDLSDDVFSPDEVEQESLTAAVADRVETLMPDRAFVDPLTQLRALAPDGYQFRKQVRRRQGRGGRAVMSRPSEPRRPGRAGVPIGAG
ncbi:hypothetical protein [Halalkalicoccus tibetensis]|uniref:Uncharacterized protein n=1 Tax=Halalkalicoccus tibetensis TaxID=175632 RepID=A0ABD5UWS0_9EURY